jgi:hypothetical protein
MSVSRRQARRLRSAGWEVVPVRPSVRIGRVLWWLLTGRKPASPVKVQRRGSR